MSNLLFEIGTEELPASFLQPALQQLRDNFRQKAKDLDLAHGSIEVLGTPRRLALLVEGLVERQPDKVEELLGPSKKAGLADDGSPTRAAEGFARSKGASVGDLKVVETEKGEYLMLIREVKGKATELLLPSVLHQLILDFSFPKSMKWGSNTLAFARPIQWILAKLDNQVLELEHEGLTAAGKSRGHRFMNNNDIDIDNLQSYVTQLDDAHIVVDPQKRRAMVVDEVKMALAQADDLQGADVYIDENLVDIVTNLVERPHGVCGRYDEKFLVLPDEVLITSMREHQKYFPVVNSKKELLPAFIAVNNTQVADKDVTRKGHERVLRARLEDALFFFNTDKERKLESHCENLSGIIFQAKLGSMHEKNERIVKLTRMLAEKYEPDSVEKCVRTAQLCKADLLTDMVGEFPSLQGIMGRAYASHEGEDTEVTRGIEEHYMPKRAGAQLPVSVTGTIVGLADRIDTMAGCFGIGQVPTGTTDPFGLRRLALAVLSLINEKNYPLSLEEIFHKALALYGDKVDGSTKSVQSIIEFIKGRYVNDAIAKGADPGAVEAVTQVVFDEINDCNKRIDAFMTIRSETAFSLLASSFKRIRNIIKDNSTTAVDETLLKEDAERALYSLLVDVREEMEPLIKDGQYLQALEVMLKMKEPVDVFFDNVMVMSEDPGVRQNRLNLLTALGALVLQIGDISKMQSA